MFQFNGDMWIEDNVNQEDKKLLPKMQKCIVDGLRVSMSMINFWYNLDET